MDIRDKRLTESITEITARRLNSGMDATEDEYGYANFADGIADDYAGIVSRLSTCEATQNSEDAMIKTLHRTLKNWDVTLTARYKIVADALEAYRNFDAEGDMRLSICKTCVNRPGGKDCYKLVSGVGCANYNADWAAAREESVAAIKRFERKRDQVGTLPRNQIETMFQKLGRDAIPKNDCNWSCQVACVNSSPSDSPIWNQQIEFAAN